MHVDLALVLTNSNVFIFFMEIIMTHQETNDPLVKKHTCVSGNKMKFRYQLIDERRFNYLTIQDQLTGEQFQIHAIELANNKTMMNEFCGWDARHVGVIAGHACLDPIKSIDQC